MTQKELIELVKQHHPTMGNTEIRAKLNRAQNDFCARTELIKKTYTQMTTAKKRYYPLNENILKVTDVQLDDIYIPRLIGNPPIDDDEFDGQTGRVDSGSSSDEYAWYISNDRIGIVEKVSGGITVRGVTSYYVSVDSAKEIRLYTISQATDFGTTLSQESDLPVQFREGLSHKVTADGYLRGESLNPQLHNLFMQKYEIMVKDGRKYGRSHYRQDGMIKPQDF